ncbi:sensor histidine kinase [Sphingomonas sp. MMS24-J13]|uniref:sensor histidine kinase n=1 Tax=Sphingomonas sp. MMS24-J13 TaxID=3238686 RepID=UPI00384AEECD
MASSLPSTPPSESRSFFAGVSTGVKMLLILTGALLPLGLIALLASIQSSHGKRLQREQDARIIATAEARQIDIALLRGASILRSSLTNGPTDPRQCREAMQTDMGAFESPVRFALFNSDGTLRCASPGYDIRGLSSPRGRATPEVLLLPSPGGLRFTIAGVDGRYAVGELPLALLARLLPTGDKTQGLQLSQGKTALTISSTSTAYPLGERLGVSAPIAGGQAQLDLTLTTNPISAVEILLVLLPLLMWAAAAGIGWVVVDQLLLRPLAQLQRAVTEYRGEGPLELPRLTTPSHEIRALGEAFQQSAALLMKREDELEAGLRHQVRLTREVHHRVKNNLQVVASLINLHSRGTKGEVAAAYASIQRRVDALAVVHRNHYAELEENRGVALRSLIAELTANLRGTAPAAASHMTITLDMIPAYITQDVAVPIAFLVTEIVELVMENDPAGGVAIALTPGPARDRATLSIEAPGLASSDRPHHPGLDRFERIVLGLSRQLRSPLDYDGATGRYRIAITVAEPEIADADDK